MSPRRPPSRAASSASPAAVSPRADAETLADLEEERQFLLDSLRDLESEREAGEIRQEDYATLRDDYTARAAAVLRRIEAAKASRRATRRARPRSHSGATVRESGAPATTSPISSARGAAGGGRRRRRRTALTVAAVVGVVAVAAVSVLGFAGDRIANQQVSGRDLSTPAGRLAQAHVLESQGKAADALKLYDAVLREEPANVEALTYKGWVLARAGLTDPAMAALDQAIALDPKYPDAHFFRGMVLYQGRNDPAGAVAEFEAFLANNPPPDSVAVVKDVLERARRDAGMPPAAGSTPPPAPPPAG
ncbi:MAG TPA: tetratricopeptide repeat protein [Acidimicrobiales bacterium]|nr:tetratricopeptide repeat protein [Acidimicrobiales bacterium]